MRGIALWALAFLILPGGPAVQALANSEPLAEVDGLAITAGEIEQAIGLPLARLQEQTTP